MPEFIVVGPPRTATTWLDHVLRGHVGLPSRTKETHFFARNYAEGLEWYAQHFVHCPSDQPVGEICASYFENSEARDRIYNLLPECKIICTLRDPVDRLYSYYKLMRQKGRTGLPFEKALRKHGQMLECSRYAYHVSEWQAQFGTENVLVLLNDDLVADSQSYLDRITTFIGIPRIVLPETAGRRDKAIDAAPRSVWVAGAGRKFRFWSGARKWYRARRLMSGKLMRRLVFKGGQPFPRLDPAIEARLRVELTPEVAALEELLQRDLSKWKTVRQSVRV